MSVCEYPEIHRLVFTGAKNVRADVSKKNETHSMCLGRLTKTIFKRCRLISREPKE